MHLPSSVFSRQLFIVSISGPLFAEKADADRLSAGRTVEGRRPPPPGTPPSLRRGYRPRRRCRPGSLLEHCSNLIGIDAFLGDAQVVIGDYSQNGRVGANDRAQDQIGQKSERRSHSESQDSDKRTADE